MKLILAVSLLFNLAVAQAPIKPELKPETTEQVYKSDEEAGEGDTGAPEIPAEESEQEVEVVEETSARKQFLFIGITAALLLLALYFVRRKRRK